MALVVRAQRQTNGMQSQIGAAALVGNWKTVAADAIFAAADDGVTDDAGADDDDAAVASGMGADAGDGRVVDVGYEFERMRMREKLLKRALAADAGEPDACDRLAQRIFPPPPFGPRG